MRIITLTCAILTASMLSAQRNIDNLLAAGIDDARRFTSDYLRPATDGLMYSMNQGWFTHGKAKKTLGFELGIIVNGAFVSDKNQTFTLNTDEYQNLQFQQDGVTSREVSTAFGDIENVGVLVEGNSNGALPDSPDARFNLPNGLGSSNINIIPTAFIQASLGIIKGTEVRVRFLPKVNAKDTDVSFYGFGVQHELTTWLPADKVFPVAISALIAFTHLDGSYKLQSSSFVRGENQKLENSTNTTLFQLIGSTKLPVINFYGGLGYITGKATTDLKGSYQVRSGIISSETITDPFSIESKVSGVRATVGTRLKLGFLRFHADYTLAKYSGLSIGLQAGFR